MKVFLLIICLQLIILPKIYSQDSLININKIQISNTFDYKSSSTKYIFSEGRYVYTIKIVKRLLEIYRFDTKLNEVINLPADSSIHAKDITLLTISKFGKDYIILYKKKRYNSNIDETFKSLFYRKIDFESGEISAEEKLHEMRPIQSEDYEYCISPNNAFLMIYNYFYQDDKLVFKSTIYQDSFKIFDKGSVKIPTNTTESIDQIFITNFAKPYITIRSSDNQIKKIFKVELEFNRAEEYIPNSQSKEQFSYAYFSNKNEANFLSTNDKGRHVIIQNIKDKDILTDIEIPHNVYQIRANKGHFRELLLLYTRPCPNDEIMIIMQEYYKKVVRENQVGFVGNAELLNVIKDYREDRLVMRLDKEKKIRWAANIPQQKGSFETEMKHLLVGNTHYFFTIIQKIDNGSLCIPPDEDISKENSEMYNKSKSNKVNIVQLTTVNDITGEFSTIDLFNAEYQKGLNLGHLNLNDIIITNNKILIEINLHSSSKNTILSIPLK